MGPRAVAVFDFDGTLCDTPRLMVEEFNRLSSFYGHQPLSEERAYELRDHDMAEVLSELDVARWKLPFLVYSMRRALKKRVEDFSFYEGAEQCLRKLNACGVELCVLSSNSEHNIRTFLDREKMNCFAAMSFGASVFGKEKKLKRFLHKRYSLADRKVYYIGDESRDLRAAKACGISGVGVTWGLNSSTALLQAGADHVVDSFQELEELLCPEAPLSSSV